ETGIPVVATQDIHYLMPEDAKAQDVLLAVQTNTRLDDPDRLTMREDNFSMRSAEEMRQVFADIPEAAENTLKIAERVHIDLELGKLKLPYFDVPDGETADTFLKKLCGEGLARRYGSAIPDAARARLDFELTVIQKTGFASYFLIVQDITNWAKKNGIVVGPGRGSAAGSIISYLTNITNVDPLTYDLLFERFMNPDRISPPDVDLDFADTRRDEVLHYMTQKYGEDHVAQIITFGTMAARAAIRDAGRALGLSYGFCDEIAKMIPFGNSLSEAFEHSSELRSARDTNPDARRLLEAAMKLEGVARHASVHACGVVVTRDPLVETVPLQYAASRDGSDSRSIVTQFEMHAVEDLGLLKMDILGLKNLSVIEAAIRLIEERTGRRIDFDAMDVSDPSIYTMLAAGKTLGVFQLEGGGMTRYLVELGPTNIEDIIAMISLYRPGPMELIPQYIERKHGREGIRYLHPALEPILKKTHGIMIYQEQLMQSAQALAGFTLAEADTLRKAVGKKIKKLLDEQKDKFVAGVEKTIRSRALGNEMWHLIEPFARYGFNRSHAACYAIIAYQTAWLKHHYPCEFMTALMNADEKDVERIALFVAEAKRLNISVLAPDVNQSNEGFTPVGNDIRFGLRTIKNVGANVVAAIIDERRMNGPYSNLADLLERVQSKDLNKKSLESLIKSGALDSIGERNQMLANMERILSHHRDTMKTRRQNQESIFGLVPSAAPALALEAAVSATMDEKLRWEKELLGLYVSGHPLDTMRKMFEDYNRPIAEAAKLGEGAPVVVAGLIESIKKITTKQGDPMVFLNLLDHTGAMEAVIFPKTLQKYGHMIREDVGLKFRGRLSYRNGRISIVANDLKSF
ncbi:MAG: DNA polymerase III subunit alpha, partial [Candidatus Niyogibacteria bacterium]|nr:DNA polymerase III subunit alpha [Candidatus Niyogibacteria bacterium]